MRIRAYSLASSKGRSDPIMISMIGVWVVVFIFDIIFMSGGALSSTLGMFFLVYFTVQEILSKKNYQRLSYGWFILFCLLSSVLFWDLFISIMIAYFIISISQAQKA
jgi:hypothetical protein